MSLRACKECGKQISTDARVCPNCGKSVGHGLRAEVDKRTAIGCLAVAAGLVVFMLVFALLEERSKHSTPEQVVESKPARPLTPKQTLEEARKELETGEPEKVADMVRPLLTDPKYRTQAKQLLSRSIFKMRDQLAAGMQSSMFDAGEEVYVKATGPNKETIEFSGPLMGAVWVHQFAGSEVPAKLKSMGFRRVSFVNSITSEAWSQKLE